MHVIIFINLLFRLLLCLLCFLSLIKNTQFKAFTIGQVFKIAYEYTEFFLLDIISNILKFS